MAPNPTRIINTIFAILDESRHQIRLVNLHPAASQDELVVCSLDTVSLTSAFHAPYEGLSWCWGDANETEPIQLQGEIWHAPRNLVIALRALRQQYEFRTLWIDALSINQCISSAALQERSKQVQLMNKIYASAESVFVWLGQDQPWTETFFSSLQHLSKLTGHPVEACEEILRHGHVDSSNHLMFARWLWELILRPWWRRAWILQEIVLAREAIVGIGSSTISLQDLLGAFIAIQNSWRYLPHLSRADTDRFMSWNAYVVMLENLHVYGVSNLLQSFSDNLSIDKTAPKLDVFSTLAQVLVACRFQLATDPKDMIYGFLGMMPEVVSQFIKPEYEISYQQVYTRTAFTIIQQTKSLFIVSQAQISMVHSPNQTSQSSLPSWVPDWSLRRRLVGYSMENRAGFRLDRESLFNCSGEVPARANLVNKHILKTKGIEIDTVLSIHRLWEKDATQQNYIPSLSFLREWIDKFSDNIETPYRTIPEMCTAFWRAFFHDMQPIDTPTALSPSSPNSNTLTHPRVRCEPETITKCEEWRSAYETYISQKPHQSQDINQNDNSKLPPFPFPSQTHDRTFTGIRLFTTKSGYIGLCNAAVYPFSHTRTDKDTTLSGSTADESVNTNSKDKEEEEGDKVVTLAGGTHPFILRSVTPGAKEAVDKNDKTDKRYKIICECFVSGIMDGEIVRGLDKTSFVGNDTPSQKTRKKLGWEEILIE